MRGSHEANPVELEAGDSGGSVAGVGRRVRRHGQAALAPGFSARQRALERASKLGRQRVVENGVDGAETERRKQHQKQIIQIPQPIVFCGRCH